MKYCILFVILSGVLLSADGLWPAIAVGVSLFTSIIGTITGAVDATGNLISAIKGPSQAGGSDPRINAALAEQQRENRDNFDKVFQGIYGIGEKLDIGQDKTNDNFERVFTTLGSLDENIMAGRKETRQNFLKISANLDNLGDKIDTNQKEVLLNFASVFDKFRFLGSHLNVIDGKIQHTLDIVGSHRETDPHLTQNVVEMNSKIQRFKEHTNAMDTAFGYFMEYSNDVTAYDNDTLMNFVSTTLSHSESSPMILPQKIHNMLTSDDGILVHFTQHGINDYLVCTKHKSAQLVLFELYRMAIFAEMKGLISTTFARDLKLYFRAGTFTKERMSELQKSIRRIQEMTTSVHSVIRLLDRELRNCDSPSNKMGVDHFSFDDFINFPDSTKTRFISLNTVESDIANNRVVTGVQLKDHYGDVHIRIQEAQLGPLATINASTAYWIPLDKDVLGSKFTLRKGYTRIDIDVFKAQPGYVVTGARFREARGGVSLEVRVTPFNPITGTMDISKSNWMSNMNPTSRRQQIKLDNVKSPYEATVTPIVQSSTNQYLYFTSTSDRTEQTVVPFFDTHQLVPSTLVPLSGIGLLYKSAHARFGGYLAPVIVSLDYAQFIHVDIEIPKTNTNQWSKRLLASLPKTETTPTFKRKQLPQLMNTVASNCVQNRYKPFIIAIFIASMYLL